MLRTGSRATAIVAIVVAMAIVGTAGTAAELAPDALGSIATSSWRAVLGGACLLVVTVGSGRSLHVPRGHRVHVVVAGAAVAVNQVAFIGAVDRAGVAVGTLVTVATIPLASGLADRIVGGLVPRWTWFVGVAVSLAGVGSLTGTGADVDAAGVALGVLAGAMVPVFGIVAQRAMDAMAPVAAMAVVFAGGGVVLAPFAVATAPEAFDTAGSTVAVVYLGVVTIGLIVVIWSYALARIAVSDFAAVTPVEPAVAAVLSVSVLDEDLTVGLVVGVVLVVAGVAVSAVGAARSVASAPQAPAGG